MEKQPRLRYSGTHGDSMSALPGKSEEGERSSPRFCDLVMKGGITSGVIYPSAAVRLANVYTFRNIGGTSAGAIAAAVTAAAEYGRQSGNEKSFDQLAAFPSWIGAPGRLLGMFAPSRATRGLFELVTIPLLAQGWIGWVFAFLRVAIGHFYWAGALGLVLVAALFWWSGGNPWGVALALLVGLLAFLVMMVLLVSRQFNRALPLNFYGLSKAFDPASTRTDGPLINWLSTYVDQLAGRPADGPPLTFGDLASQQVNLQMMTTAVNLGRPYRVPFTEGERIFYFCPEEFRTLFPERVVKHMVDHAPERKGTHPRTADGKTLVAFPDAEQLPVVVGTRMSLSFPILLAAVPLYAVDFTRTFNQHLGPGQQPLAERCWFSDGGETSNLPIHFFDSPIPEWPTFAINLKQFHPDFEKEEDAVWLPMRNDSGWRSQWTRFEAPGQFGSPFGFLGAIFSAMQNWQDNTLSLVPGYRDRIVSISLRDNEGGYNLNMDSAMVNRLSDRGTRAGEALIQRFYQGDGWINHVWLRFRSCAQLTGHWLKGLSPAEGGSVGTVIGDGIRGNAPSYQVMTEYRPNFERGSETILSTTKGLDDEALRALDTGAPRPQPQLCIRPKV
jgi:Patatin-like phospholipase